MNCPKLLPLALSLSLAIGLPTLNVDRTSVFWSSQAIAQGIVEDNDPAMHLYRRAQVLMSSGFTEEGIVLYDRAVQHLQERGNHLSAIDLLNSIADHFQTEGDLQHALTYYQRSLTLAGGRMISPVDRSLQLTMASRSASEMGSIYLMLGQPEQAIAAYQRELAIDRRSEIPWITVVALSDLGNAYQQAGQTEEALATYQQAIALCEEIGDLYVPVKVLNQIGMIYQAQGNFEQALAAYQQALATASKQPESLQATDHILTLENISTLYQAQGQTEQAENYTQQAATVLTERSVNDSGEPDLTQGGNFLREIGTFYLVNGQPERAKSYFDRALAIVRDKIGGYPESSVLSRIVGIYIGQGQIEQAIPYQQRSVELARNMSALEAGRSLLRLGEMYEAIGQLDQALSTYQKAIVAYQETDPLYQGQRQYITQTLLRIGAVYQAQGAVEPALTTFQQALTQFQEAIEETSSEGVSPEILEEQIPSVVGQIRALESLAALYQNTGQTDRAQQYAQQAQMFRRQLLQ